MTPTEFSTRGSHVLRPCRGKASQTCKPHREGTTATPSRVTEPNVPHIPCFHRRAGPSAPN